MKKPPDWPVQPVRAERPVRPVMVVRGPGSPLSSAGDEHESRAAQLRESIRFTLVERILNTHWPPIGQAGWEHFVDRVLQHYLGDLGAVLADADAHRRRIASLKKPATSAELYVVSRLRDMRRAAAFYDQYPEATTNEHRRLLDNPVATLAAELQSDLAGLARDDPQRARLEEIYRILQKGSNRVLEIYDRVLPELERCEAFMKPSPPDPPDPDE